MNDDFSNNYRSQCYSVYKFEHISLDSNNKNDVAKIPLFFILTSSIQKHSICKNIQLIKKSNTLFITKVLMINFVSVSWSANSFNTASHYFVQSGSSIIIFPSSCVTFSSTGTVALQGDALLVVSDPQHATLLCTQRLWRAPGQDHPDLPAVHV